MGLVMTDKKRPHTPMQTAFLDALMSEAGGNLRKAMDIAGYSRQTTIQEVCASLKDDIIERASMALALNAPKAAFGMIGVLDDPTAMGAKNSIAAASQVLDRVGLVKKDTLEVKSQGQAIFILPPKQDEDAAQD